MVRSQKPAKPSKVTWAMTAMTALTLAGVAHAQDSTSTVLPAGTPKGTVPSPGQKINRLPPNQQPATVRAKPSTTSSSTTGTSTATVSTTSSILSNISSYYSGTYAGSSIVNPLASTFPDTATDSPTSAAGVQLSHQVGVGYRLNERVRFGIAGGITQTSSVGAVIDDPQIRASLGSLVKAGPLSVAGEARYYIPASTFSQSIGSMGAIQLRQNLNLAFAKSRFSASMLLKETTKILPTYKNQVTVSGYAGPQLAYQLNPKVQLWALLETSAAHISGTGLTASVDDFEPGVSWDILPNLTFTPYLDLKIATGMTLNTTSVNANLTWSFL